MDSARHIALVTPGFPRDEADTSCIPPLQIALRRLRQCHQDIRITVLALHYPKGRSPYRWHGLEVAPMGGANRPLPLRLPTLARASNAICRRHAQDPFDAVHALWLSDTAMVGWWAARRLRLPFIATAMGQDARSSNRWLSVLPLGSAQLTAVSQRASTELQHSIGRAADVVIPWGLDLPIEDLPAWNDRPIDLLGVGSLTENKDYAVLLETAAELVRTGRECRVVLIGDGEQRAALEAMVQDFGLADCVSLEGQLSREEVLERMRRAKILIHPARYESFGFVFSEALANGMTVLSRPVGAASAGARWRLCDTAASFTAACGETLDHPPGTQAMTVFSEDHTADALAELYHRTKASR
jgi:1,2-diacylglycerol 3-alpha-glucosyltransferase